MNRERLAIRLMIAQAALFAAETAIIHELGSTVSVMQLALLRGAGGMVLAIVLARSLGSAIIRTRQLPLQLLRGTVSVLYLWVMIYSFGHLPFADATAISFTQAAYIAGFSIFILGETVSRSLWVAVTIGMLGAMLIVKPAFAGWNGVYLIALFGTGLNGLSFVLNRYLQRIDSEATTMLYSNLVPVLASAPAAAWVGLPDPDTIPWLPILLLLGPIGMYFGIVAVRHAGAATLGPYNLLRLVIALLVGVIIFRELPDFSSSLGTVLIIASCVISSGISLKRHVPSIRRVRPLAFSS